MSNDNYDLIIRRCKQAFRLYDVKALTKSSEWQRSEISQVNQFSIFKVHQNYKFTTQQEFIEQRPACVAGNQGKHCQQRSGSF
jgi:hypothetical protein